MKKDLTMNDCTMNRCSMPGSPNQQSWFVSASGRALAGTLAILLVILPGRWTSFCAWAPPACAAAEPADRHPGLRRLSPTDEVWVDIPGKRVIIGGRVALASGPIEVFACPEKTKEYESLVATRAPARLVHAALLAIGLEPGHPVSFDPDYVAAAGPVVTVTLRWRDPEGNVREARGQEWIRNARTGAALDVDWVFAGSSFWQDPSDGSEVYEADQGDLICVSNFPTATLDLPIESSQTNEELLFEAFEGRVPPKDTAIELILAPAH